MLTWRRGFLRLWIVFTGVWLLGGLAGGIFYGLKEYEPSWTNYLYLGPGQGFEEFIPVSAVGDIELQLPPMAYVEFGSGAVQVYFEPEHDGIWQDAFAEFATAELADFERQKWKVLKIGAVVFLSVPAILMVAGLLVAWVLAGFRRAR